jgi:hypothetical protein
MKKAEEVKTIHVVGLGGVGFHLATILARESQGRSLWAWDADTLEGGNGWQRLPVSSSPQQTKTSLLRTHVGYVWEEKVPTLREEWFIGKPPEGHTEGWLQDALVVDCTDMGNLTRAEMWKESQKQGALMLRASYDGNGVVVVAWGLPFGDTDHGGYERVPTLAQSFTAAGLAAQVVHKFLQGMVVDEVVMRV